MISGASEEELDIANARADIMVALKEKYGNYDLLKKLDKYQENEKQQLISFLEHKIKVHEENIAIYKKEKLSILKIYAKAKKRAYQETLDFVNKDGKK